MDITNSHHHHQEACLRVVKGITEKFKCILLGFALGLPIYVITTLSRDFETPVDFACGIIEKWLHHYPERFNIENLQKALLDMGDHQLASEIDHLAVAGNSEPGIFTQKRRMVIEHVVTRRQESEVMEHLKEKLLILVNGPVECGRTVFLNEIHNTIVSEYPNAKVIFYPSSYHCVELKEIACGMQELVCPSMKSYNIELLRFELFRQAKLFTPLVLIMDLPHSQKSLSSIMQFLTSIFQPDNMPPKHLRVILTTCSCVTSPICKHFLKFKYAVEVKLTMLDKGESFQLLEKVNPSIDEALANRLFKISKGSPSDLCYLGRMSLEQRDTQDFMKQLDRYRLPQLFDYEESYNGDVDQHLLAVMKLLRTKERRILVAQLLIFPNQFTQAMMIHFTQFDNDRELLVLAYERFYLLNHDPATNRFCFSNSVRCRLLDIIKNDKYFPEDKLYNSYCSMRNQFCRAHIKLLDILSLQFLDEDVKVPHDIEKRFFHPGCYFNRSKALYEKAIYHTKCHFSNIVYSIEELMEDLNVNVGLLLCLLELRVIYLLQKYAIPRKVINIYLKLLNFFESNLNECKIYVAKVKVAIVFIYLYHLSWKWYTDQAITMINDSLTILKDTDEYEALGSAHLRIGRLLVAKGISENNHDLRSEGLTNYKRGLAEWKRPEIIAKASMKTLIAVAHRHEAVIQLMLGDLNGAHEILDKCVVAVYQSHNLCKHPFYATACCFKGKLLMKHADYDSATVEGLIRRSIEIRNLTLGLHHPDTVTSLKALGKCYVNLYDPVAGDTTVLVKAMKYLQDAANRSLYVLGHTDQTAAILHQLADCQEKLGLLTDAQVTRNKASQITEEFETLMKRDMLGLVFPDDSSFEFIEDYDL